MSDDVAERLKSLRDGPGGSKRLGRKRRPSKTTISEPTTEEQTQTPNYTFHDPVKAASEIIFQANAGPQEDFLAAPQQEVLFGGAAGGGKSYALLADAARELGHPSFRGLIVRKTTEELRELIQKSQELYPRVIPGIKWNERAGTWKTPAGGSLWMSFLERDQDVTRYQGQAFSYIAFDELTQWATPYCWDYMRSRLRTTASGLGLYQRATSNPGGLGHHWVKKMFIDPAPANKAFWARDVETNEVMVYPDDWDEESLRGKPLFKRKFIPSRLKDNPYLHRDGAYARNLLSLPEVERKRLLTGDWDIAEGNAFPEWNRSIHVIEPYEIPRSWRRFRSCDYGYGSWSSVLWFAITPEEQLVVYRELYVSKVLAVDLADMVLDMEKHDGPISYGVLDSSVWRKTGDAGPSLAEAMINRGCRWRPSDRSKGSRIAGKNELHRRLQVDTFLGAPRLVIFSTCNNLIAHLPVLPLDPVNPEDVYTKGDDHDYDALRYGIMTRPISHVHDAPPQKIFTPADPHFGY